MTQKWNLGDIVPADREKKSVVRTSAPMRQNDMRRPEPSVPRADPEPRQENAPSRKRPKPKRRLLKIAIIAVVAIIVGTTFGVFFGGATVVAYPKSRNINVEAPLKAYDSAAAGELVYEVLELTAEDEKLVTATGQEEVSEQASGKITIYNSFSETPQRLITNTRFQSSGGLVYRMSESVVVPGYTKASDGSIKPGTMTATIYASETGDRYNIPPGKLTLPGLTENKDQFAKIYGELKEPMVGGFEGLRYIVPENELATARKALQDGLRTTLMAKLAEERPNGFILFESSLVFSYATVSTTDAGNQHVAIREQAKLQAPIFPDKAFASYITERTLAGYEGESVRIENPNSLRFSYTNGTPATLAGEINFSLSGTAKVIWNYDAEALRQDLRGVSKNGIPLVAAGYPAIDKLNASIKPFWRKNFPDDIQKITITERIEP